MTSIAPIIPLTRTSGKPSRVLKTSLTSPHRHVGTSRIDGTVRIAFDRPEVRNAFRPHTVDEPPPGPDRRPHIDNKTTVTGTASSRCG